MMLTRLKLVLLVFAALALLAGCKDQSDNDTKHRSLADAAANLRSNAMVDTTWRGHIKWNGSARILKQSECYLLDRDYLLVGTGDGVTLRLIYRAERSGEAGSVDFARPVQVDLQLDQAGSEGAYYRVEPPVSGEIEISSEQKSTIGRARLKAFNDAARRETPDGVLAEFEFRCS